LAGKQNGKTNWNGVNCDWCRGRADQSCISASLGSRTRTGATLALGVTELTLGGGLERMDKTAKGESQRRNVQRLL